MYKSSFREDRTARIHSAKKELKDSVLVTNVQYISGGFEEFDPNRGELMVPECVQLKLNNESCLATKSILSKICDRYNLRIQIPDHKQNFGQGTIIRLVNNKR